MLVSIVVRSYNYDRFLREAIDSALAQTYESLEVVVVDDGSTDGSRAIIEGYGELLKPVFKLNEGGGATSFEAGLAACSGEVVLFLDSDDVLSPTVAAEAAAILRDPRYVRVSWLMEEVDAAGAPTGRHVPVRELPEGDMRAAMIEGGPMVGDGPPTSGNAWSRSFLESVFPMPEPRTGMYVDSYMHALAGLSGMLGRISEPRGKYRNHGSNRYAGMSLSDRLTNNLSAYHQRCRLQSQFLLQSGNRHDPNRWKAGTSYYDQLWRRYTVFQELIALMPVGSTFVLIDEGVSGDGSVLTQRPVLRFPDTTDRKRGRPHDDSDAIATLESLRADGATFCAFVKPALWWLRRYAGFRNYLHQHYSCELEKENVVAFNLLRRL